MGTQKCKAAPWSFLGSHNLKHQNMEQLNKPGRSTAFHQEPQDLSMGNTKGTAQHQHSPCGEAEKVMPCFPILTGKKVSAHLKASPCQSNPRPFCDTAAAPATGKVAEDGCPDRAAALSSINTSWFSEIIYKSVVVKKRLLEAEGPAEPPHPYQSLCD